jgi:Tfp pilus assembly protein PilV
MKIYKIQKNKGFTLVETMVAVLTLAIAITALIGLTAKNLFYARYAKNEIVANYLIQETIDSIKNNRDTTAFQNKTTGGWVAFTDSYSDCFSPSGCYFEVTKATTITPCPTSGEGINSCPVLYYDDNHTNGGYYTYNTNNSVPSIFKRQIIMSSPSDYQVDVQVNVEWQNGDLTKTKSTTFSLLNWQNS